MAQIITYKLLVLAWITAQRQLIHEKTASRSEWKAKYDFIVVGAGSAGSAVAMRLSEDKAINVLLLEAGGPQSAVYNDIPEMVYSIAEAGVNIWNYYTVPQKHSGKQYASGRIPDPKGKTLGGSSAHNGMVYNRGNRKDFDHWVKTYGAKGWTYEEILPYFKKFENNTDRAVVEHNPDYHGTNGPVQIVSKPNDSNLQKLLQTIYSNLGFKETDINGAKQSGYMRTQLFIDTNGLRAGTGNAYIDPNPHPDNLHIVCKALVVKILFNGLTAIGVTFIKNSKSYKIFANKEVIISAGPINSAQLLMLSGIGQKEHLDQFGIKIKQDLPVGENYMDHPAFLISSKLNSLLTRAKLKHDQLAFNQADSLSTMPALTLLFSTKNNRNSDHPNAYFGTSVINDTFYASLYLSRIRSYGSIRLQSINPLVPPLIDPNLLSHSQDFEDFVDIIRFAYYLLDKSDLAKYITTTAFSAMGCPDCPRKQMFECIEGIKCIIRQFSYGASHGVGSCRMGSIDRSDVVVDPYLRVKNVRNLRVCDSSVFPKLPNANTNSASIMVGEKCAQIVKNFYHQV